jgi:hypothetical protein
MRHIKSSSFFVEGITGFYYDVSNLFPEVDTGHTHVLMYCTLLTSTPRPASMNLYIHIHAQTVLFYRLFTQYVRMRDISLMLFVLIALLLCVCVRRCG